MKIIEPQILGQRLKFFRERARISQFELENKISAANGMISRIESGKVNPNKETVQRIAEILKLHARELDYLVGSISSPANNNEIKLVKEETNEYLNKKSVIGYLVDERWQFINVSGGFPRLLGLPDNEREKIIGKTIIEIILDPQYGLVKFLDKSAYESLIESQLKDYYVMNGFMIDDEVFQRTLECIENHPIASKVWDSLTYENTKGFLPLTSRVVNFKIGKFNIPMKYSREPLFNYPRFVVVEYTPVNKFIRVVQKLLN